MGHLILKMGNMGNLKKTIIKKWGISKKHVINFKTEKEPKMKFFYFGAF